MRMLIVQLSCVSVPYFVFSCCSFKIAIFKCHTKAQDIVAHSTCILHKFLKTCEWMWTYVLCVYSELFCNERVLQQQYVYEWHLLIPLSVTFIHYLFSLFFFFHLFLILLETHSKQCHSHRPKILGAFQSWNAVRM